MKSLDKNKTKELDCCWQKEFLSSGSMNGCGDLSIMISTVSNILTQQRTELLEEIPKKIKGKNKEFVGGYNNAIDDITNLLNKKDE